jgi:hypothetical protein
MVSTSRLHAAPPPPGRTCDVATGSIRDGKEALMIPLLLWILGVPGLIIILLLLLGVIHI